MLLFSWVRKMSKILIIEDDKNIQRLLTLELRHKNYVVDSAYNGEQGIEMFSKNTYNQLAHNNNKGHSKTHSKAV